MKDFHGERGLFQAKIALSLLFVALESLLCMSLFVIMIASMASFSIEYNRLHEG